MILDAINKSIEIVLGDEVTTNQLPVVSSWADITTTTFIPGEYDTLTGNVTPVTIVAAPAASTQRQIKEIMVFNADTVSATVQIRYNNNTVISQLTNVTIEVGECLVYREGFGWMTLGVDGSIKTSGAQGAHKTSHQDGGSDEIDVTGLAGIPTDAQKFVARGHVAAADKATADFTKNGTYVDWDLSLIIPVGTVAILLKIFAQTTNSAGQIRFRPNGETNDVSDSTVTCHSQTYGNAEDLIVPVGSDRIIEYKADNLAWTHLYGLIAGWWVECL